MDEQTREEAVSLKIKLLREKSRNIEKRHKLVEEDKRRAEQSGTAVNSKQASSQSSRNYKTNAHMDEPFGETYDTSYRDEHKDHRRGPRDTKEYFNEHGQGDGHFKGSSRARHQGPRHGDPVKDYGDYRHQRKSRDAEYQDEYEDPRARYQGYHDRGPNRSRESPQNNYQQPQQQQQQQQQQRGIRHDGRLQGNRRAAEREQQRLNNVKLMDDQLHGKIQRGDKEWQDPKGFLQDSLRQGEGEFSRRPPPRNVRYNPNDSRNRQSNYRNQGGKMDRMLDMTGKQRRDYDTWKQQQEEADKERLARSQANGGGWRRDWDNEKNVDFDDDSRERRDYGRGRNDRGGRGGDDRGGRGGDDREGGRHINREMGRSSEQYHGRDGGDFRSEIRASHRSRDYDDREHDETDREPHPDSDARRTSQRVSADDAHGNEQRRLVYREDRKNSESDAGNRDRRPGGRHRGDFEPRHELTRRSNSNEWGQEADAAPVLDQEADFAEVQGQNYHENPLDRDQDDADWPSVHEATHGRRQPRNDGKRGRDRRDDRPYQSRGQDQRTRSYNNRRDERPRHDNRHRNDDPRNQRPLQGNRYQNRPNEPRNRGGRGTRNQKSFADAPMSGGDDGQADSHASLQSRPAVTGSNPNQFSNAESRDVNFESRDLEQSDKMKASRNKANLKVQIKAKTDQSKASQDGSESNTAPKRSSSSSLTSPLKTPDNFVPVGDWALEVEMSNRTYEEQNKHALDPIVEGKNKCAGPDVSDAISVVHDATEEVFDANKDEKAISDNAPLLDSAQDEEEGIDKEELYCRQDGDDRSSSECDDDNDDVPTDDKSNLEKTDDDDGDSFSTCESGQFNESVEYQRLVDETSDESSNLPPGSHPSDQVEIEDTQSNDNLPEESQTNDNLAEESLKTNDNLPEESPKTNDDFPEESPQANDNLPPEDSHANYNSEDPKSNNFIPSQDPLPNANSTCLPIEDRSVNSNIPVEGVSTNDNDLSEDPSIHHQEEPSSMDAPPPSTDQEFVQETVEVRDEDNRQSSTVVSTPNTLEVEKTEVESDVEKAEVESSIEKPEVESDTEKRETANDEEEENEDMNFEDAVESHNNVVKNEDEESRANDLNGAESLSNDAPDIKNDKNEIDDAPDVEASEQNGEILILGDDEAAHSDGDSAASRNELEVDRQDISELQTQPPKGSVSSPTDRQPEVSGEEVVGHTSEVAFVNTEERHSD